MSIDLSKDWQELIIRVSELVNTESGNVLGERQKTMVENRLRNRMLEQGITDPRKYRVYLESHLEVELNELVSLITTHHTFFFREFTHFDYLKENLKKIVENVKKDGRNTLYIWSAACSRGHEVYSIAMFLEYHLKQISTKINYKIIGSDIDPLSLKIASNGVYHWNEIKSIPMIYQEGNWQRGKGTISDFVKVKDHLKSKCEFTPVNLIKNHEWPEGKFDLIFCRNVFIYFDMKVVETLANSFIKKLSPSGYFISGISESLAHYNVQAHSIGSSIYMDSKHEYIQPSESNPYKNNQKLIKVICVDDSPSMLKIYSKILTPVHGFQIVAVAKNGEEAEQAKREHSFDVMTLDIHMPVMNGIEYLEKNYNQKHAPIIIISSVSRSDSSLAVKAMALGISDFVEKPEIKNMVQVGDEIRTKLKVAMLEKKKQFGHSIDKQFIVTYDIKSMENKLQCFVASIRDIPKIERYFRDFRDGYPAAIILYHGQFELIDEFKLKLEKALSSNISTYIDKNVKSNSIYLLGMNEYFDSHMFTFSNYDVAFLVYGRITEMQFNKILNVKKRYILLEDLNSTTGEDYISKVNELTPETSFSYLIKKHFSR